MSPSPEGSFPTQTIFPATDSYFRGQLLWRHLLAMATIESTVASPGGTHETITLHAETRTPRRRTLSASFVRKCTPPGEVPPARRKRLKAESSTRSRAMCRLEPEKHTKYLVAERARKQGASGKLTVYGPWPQKVRDRVKQEHADFLEAQRQREIDENFEQIIAHEEAQGRKRIRLGPPGWHDAAGWIWEGRDGRICDRSRIQVDNGQDVAASQLWHEKGAALCGICECDECGITQHPCACERPDPLRANWGPVPVLWMTNAYLRERGYVSGTAGMNLWATPRRLQRK